MSAGQKEWTAAAKDKSDGQHHSLLVHGGKRRASPTRTSSRYQLQKHQVNANDRIKRGRPPTKSN